MYLSHSSYVSISDDKQSRLVVIIVYEHLGEQRTALPRQVLLSCNALPSGKRSPRSPAHTDTSLPSLFLPSFVPVASTTKAPSSLHQSLVQYLLYLIVILRRRRQMGHYHIERYERMSFVCLLFPRQQSRPVQRRREFYSHSSVLEVDVLQTILALHPYRTQAEICPLYGARASRSLPARR